MLLLPFLIHFVQCLQLYWDANCKAIADFREIDLCKVRTMNMDQHHWWGWLGVKVISLSGCWLHKCLHVSYMSELSSNFFCYIVTTSFTSLQATWCRFSVKPCMCRDLTCQMMAFFEHVLLENNFVLVTYVARKFFEKMWWFNMTLSKFLITNLMFLHVETSYGE